MLPFICRCEEGALTDEAISSATKKLFELGSPFKRRLLRFVLKGQRHELPSQCAIMSPYSTESARARQLASMIFVLAPTVLQRLVLFRVSINTRVIASVP